MTENRKRVTVRATIQNGSRIVNASAQKAGRTVGVEALPVREITPETYVGKYEVSPDFSGQVLETRSKYMTDDITIDPIYISDTENLAGGITIYIGGEFYA